LEGQSPSRALPKACVCRRERRGRQYEKGSEIRMHEQARPSDSGPFSCPFHGRDHAKRDRPAAWLCGCACGGTPPQRRDGGNARHSVLHLISRLSGDSFPSRGSLKDCCQRWRPHYRAAAATYSPPLILPQQNGGTDAPRTKAAVRRAMPCRLRSKLKKTEKIMGSSLLESLRFPVFFNQLPRHLRSQLPIQTQVLWYFLDARKYRPPLVPRSPAYSGKPGSTAVVRTFCAPAARIRPICAALREKARVEICCTPRSRKISHAAPMIALAKP